MGFFSRKKEIIVSSSAYNLAGDQKDRVQFLPTLIIGDILAPSSRSLGEVITQGLLSGHGIRMRNFARWARTSGYTSLISQQTSKLSIGNSIDNELLLPQLPVVVGQTPVIQSAEISEADYGYWAEVWLLENHPESINADYELDFSETTNTIYINMPGGVVYSFNPVGFDAYKQYLYVSYYLEGVGTPGPIVPGTIITVGSDSEFPDTSTWTFNGHSSVSHPVDLVTLVDTVVSYSDARPNETTSSSTSAADSYDTHINEYEHTVYVGQPPGDPHKITSLRSIQYETQSKIVVSTPAVVVTTETIAGGVVKTTTVTTTTDTLADAFSYIVDTQEIVDKTWSDMKIMIYQRESGNPVLDAMFLAEVDSGAFFPFIPMRLNNKFLSNSYFPSVYKANQIAMKKATGSKYKKVKTAIESNGAIGDVDHAYAMFGVSLNVRERSARKYLYKFFQFVLLNGAGGDGEYNAWQVSWNLADASKADWLSWKEAQADVSNPLYGTLEPLVLAYPPVPVKQMVVAGPTFSYNMIVKWSAMTETTGTGLGKPGAKMGEVWITQGTSVDYTEQLNSAGIAGSRVSTVDLIHIHWQDSLTTHRTMSIWNLQHVNIVYKGKSVKIGAAKALADPEESGFIIPLHEGIFRAMSLKDTTQMASANCYLVFNCYEVVREKWYQTSWFKVVLIIVVIAITIFTMGAGTGPSVGLLGTAASVGASVGLAGTAALIVGTIANALAAMILTKLLTMASTAIFGDRVGAVVGALVSIAAIAYGTGVANGQGFAASFGDMASAENIMKLTVAAGDGYTGYLSDKTAKFVADAQKVVQDYTSKSKAISDRYYEEFGSKGGVIDPLALLDSPEVTSFIPETPSMFIGRTLMTGTDIAGMSNDMLTNFATMTTSTPLG